MAFSRKRHFISDLYPDIAVVPECSQNSIQSFTEVGVDCRWFGANPQKGLGVLIAKPWRISDFREPKSKWIVPIWVSGPIDFLLLAVWSTRIHGSHDRSYIGQVWEAVRSNPDWFDGKPVLICGDFNSNAIWDNTRKTNSHSSLLKFLAERHIVSAYHHYFSEPEGKEQQPTHYFYHHKNRGFHIDYVFLPERWAERIERVEIGEYRHWAKLSDHVPLLVEVNFGSG
jgi:hypothetical protein